MLLILFLLFILFILFSDGHPSIVGHNATAALQIPAVSFFFLKKTGNMKHYFECKLDSRGNGMDK